VVNQFFVVQQLKLIKKKMKRKIIVIGIIIVLMLVLWLVFRNPNKIQKTNVLLTPTPTESISPEEERNYVENGKEDNSKDEQKVLDETGKLIDKLPFENEQFNLFFDYSVNKFVVFYKNKEINNFSVLKEWLIKNNYGNIPMEEFVIGETL
jgi:hypothetical protein